HAAKPTWAAAAGQSGPWPSRHRLTPDHGLVQTVFQSDIAIKIQPSRAGEGGRAPAQSGGGHAARAISRDAGAASQADAHADINAEIIVFVRAGVSAGVPPGRAPECRCVRNIEN